MGSQSGPVACRKLSGRLSFPTSGVRLLALGTVLCGCGKLDDEPSWTDQLVADSPCFRVDLFDGLDTQSTTELEDLFDCLNYHGHLPALEATVDTLVSSTSRNNTPAGIELAVALNAMPGVDIDPFALFGVVLEAFDNPKVDLSEVLEVGVELIYGLNVRSVRESPGSWGDLESSVLTPLADAIPPAVTLLLDEDLDAAVWFGDVLAADETKRWMRTISSWLSSDEPAVTEPLGRALNNLGHTRAATLNASNDRWAGASGDSLKDLAQVYIVQPDPVLETVSPPLANLLGDPVFAEALEQTLVSLHAQGHLQATPEQLAWMTNVDLRGDALVSANEPSALFRFLRLLANTNQPFDCTIDLWITQIPFSFGNLAVSVLEIVAELDPDDAAGAASVIALLTDNLLADWMLEVAADSGVCPTLTREVADDLIAVDVLTLPETYDLLSVAVGLLEPAKNAGQTNHIPDIADALEALHESGGTEPLEELFRDIGDQALIGDLVEVVPILADPVEWGISAGDQPPADLADAVGLLRWAFAQDPETGRTGLQWLRPLLRPMLMQNGTWNALDRASLLMRDETSQTSQALDLLPPLLELDPDLALLDTIGPLLGETQVAAPLLRALEAPGVIEALLAEQPNTGSPPPLAFLGTLILDGTFDALLGLLDLLLADLGGEFMATEPTTGPGMPGETPP